MGWLDKVPDAGDLYIGGLYSLRRQDAVKTAGITHVVSVMRWQIDENLIRPYKHLQIDVDDEDEENLLEFFEYSYQFIKTALDDGGHVLVHWFVNLDYFVFIECSSLHEMQCNGMTRENALEQLRRGRGVCEPNPGFWNQLKLYEDMNTPADIESNPIYQRWLYKRVLDASRACGQAPESDQIRFEDEHTAQKTAAGDSYDLKCRKCRRTLASSAFLVKHEPLQNPNDPKSTLPVPPSACSHYFVEALSWMRAELEHGKIEGRLECPKCKTNVGKYAWQGMQCSCGDWVIPGLSLAKSRIDESKSQSQGAQALGIRMPPGLASGKGPNQGNL